MAVEATDQLAMDERVIDDKEAERALEERDELKRELAPLNKDYRKKKEAAEFALDRHDLADGEVVRIGRFRVTRVVPESKEVSFTTDPKPRHSIAVVGEGDGE